jgi:hypothetical protein
MATGGDPDLIKRAPTDQVQADAASEEANREEAKLAKANARVAASEFRSKFGQLIELNEIIYVVAAFIVLAGFIVACVVMFKADNPFQTPAWSLLVAIVTGAVALIFAVKTRS